MDLSNMSAAELRNLLEQAKRELKKRETQDLQKAKEEIFAIAQRVGLPLKELIATNPRGKGGTVAARYRNPSDNSQQWTGRGRQPKWVKDWLDAGKSIDELRI
jgi:DNA-binding protein H-NS